MPRAKSSTRWLQEHFEDIYVKQSKLDGYRSRAAYKLIEINKKHKLINNNQNIVDLGAAPGSWLQVVKNLSKNSNIIGLDILEIKPISQVKLITGDFTENHILEELLKQLNNQPLDLVLSDMAPNLSGHREIDIPKAMYLAELATDFANTSLRKGGNLLIKVFQGNGFDNLLKSLRQDFQQVFTCKPKASRARSNEIYLLGKNKINAYNIGF